MKNIHKYLLVVLCCICACPAFAQYTETDETDRMGLMIDVGGKHIHFRNNDYDALGFDLKIHNHFNNIGFNSSFYMGKNYMGIEPFSLAGVVLFFFMKYGDYQNSGTGYDGILMGACMLSSLNFNIRISNNFAIRPYWSLLRLTKLDNAEEEQYKKFQLNGALGGDIMIIFDQFFVTAYGEYTFGWGKITPFKGYSIGATLGIKFF
jgi:hypothetical protein